MTILQFQERKTIGIAVEVELMEKIALMGGAVHAIGCIPDQPNNAPKFMHPHLASDDGITHSVSPDLCCSLPNMPRGQMVLIQVKMKDIYENGVIYLDEQELHRMQRAARYHLVRFVVKLPNDQWKWLDVDDLHESRIGLFKRKIQGKKTLIIPLYLFQPMTNFIKVSTNEAANKNTSPEAARV